VRAALQANLRQPPAGRSPRPGPRRDGDRPGSGSLEDARRVADDFVFVRTLPQSVRDFVALFDFAPLAGRFDLDYLESGRGVLIWREGPEPMVTTYDAAQRPRMQLQVELTEGYRVRAGKEYPAAGLRVLRAWEPAEDGELREYAVEEENLMLRPK
jgi:hypothetical protein